MSTETVGRITATERQPSSCNKLRFWVDKDKLIRPFDVVRVRHLHGSFTYAIVQDLIYITDSSSHLASFVSHDFGDLSAQPHNQRLGTTVAEAEVLHNTDGIEMPVRDGDRVEWADVEGIKAALGLHGLERPIPGGWLETSNQLRVPVEFDARYLLGPEGAHLNIAGISGLATKTSYAMFLLNAIQQKAGEAVTIVVFNVKGNDLLSIDEPDPDMSDETREAWRACGLEPQPFRDVTYLYPYADRPATGYTSSHASPAIRQRQQAEDRAFNYFYDVETGARRLALLFSDIEDPNSTMESIVHSLPEMPRESWAAFREEVRERTEKGSTKAGDISIMSWRRFNRLLRTRTQNSLFDERARMNPAKRHMLVREAIRALEPGRVLVVDIEPLADYLQCLVFGDVVETLYAAMLGDEDDIPPDSLVKVVIFADELNKYAPKSSASGRTLTRTMLEITERGRSLGIILFGAEQFRSGVHDRVLGNCSTNVFGRTSPVEIHKCPDYRYFPETHKSAIPRLTQGQLLLQHAVFRTSLIKVTFPRPCYRQPKGS